MDVSELYASEQKDRIDGIIARTHSNPALRIQLLTLESQTCERARLWIQLKKCMNRRNYDLNLSLTRTEMVTWETRERNREELARSHANSMAWLRHEYAAFGAAKEVADEHIHQAQSAWN